MIYCKTIKFKGFIFRKSNISWHQQKRMRFVKYHAQLQIWRPWIIICTFVVFYSNVIEKSRLYEKLGHFYWCQQNWSAVWENVPSVSKCAKVHCHYACYSEVMGRAVLTLLLQIKSATPIICCLSPKNKIL